MLDRVTGTVVATNEKTLVFQVGGLGLSLAVPKAMSFALDTSYTLHTYMHWNAEQGFSLYGFKEPSDRSLFLLLLDCPKIGPSLALTLIDALGTDQIVQAIIANNETTFSNVSGIGAKKAEQIILSLKHKIQKLLASGIMPKETQGDFVQWQQVREVLNSLNYSQQEVGLALKHITQKYTGTNPSLDTLLRSSLAFLTGPPRPS